MRKDRLADFSEMDEVVLVPGGVLKMGSSQEEVRHCLREWRDRLLDESYVPAFESWISKESPQHLMGVNAFMAKRFPVTNAEFSQYLTEAGGEAPESIASGVPDDHPVWGVTLPQAQAFAGWKQARDHRPWRLPTEAEWEWMAAGPERLRYPYGMQFDPRRGNSIESGIGMSTPVHAHSLGASWCGVEDLAGNVEEWTASRYAPYPGGQFIEDDLTRLVGPEYPIVRGGSFELGGDLTRTSRRHGPHPGRPFRIIGFRLVHDGLPS
jgi:formylglycine-generating enzyme required for sulfatase activity